MEHETKLDVPDGAAVPDLTHLPGVVSVAVEEVDLAAQYFDTADVRLLRARTTLRRRTGGADEGWHLKRPLQGDRRSETHLPLGRATRTVPAPLRRLVRVHVRDATLVPVATLRTHRTLHRLLDAEGTVLAEVCDDVVDGRVGDAEGTGSSWREWEVELAAGDEALLAAAVTALTAAGATPSDRASKVGRVLDPVLREHARPEPSSGLRRKAAGNVVWEHLAAQVARLQEHDPLVRGDEPDAVHQMRVASRRLRSALKTFRPLLDRSVTDPLRSELKALGRVLGDARDAEVQRDRLRSALDAQDGTLVLGPVARRLELEDGYRAAHDAVLEHLESERYLTLLDDLDALVTTSPWRDKADRKAATVLTRRVRKADKAFRAAATHALELPDGDEQDDALHETRKAAKRARYAAEAVAPALGSGAAAYAEAVEAVQDALGEHQDGVTARRLLRETATRAHLQGENAFTFGILHGLEQRRGADAQDAFRAAWAEASRKRHRSWLA